MTRLFVDTSAWYALVDRRDPDHTVVARCLEEANEGLLTTNFVFDETVTLLRYRLGYAVAAKFGAQLLTGRIATLVAVTRKDEDLAWSIFTRYKDKSFSFTDCTSFAVMDRLKIDRAAAIDDDFRTYGKTCIPS